ncbi:hypothetical protein PLIP_a0788 [Pseudoalteromonas lipolytica LMEB 39]|nr:hypothetical protein [Pseudoalteromonas lipolytica LMEB 39]
MALYRIYRGIFSKHKGHTAPFCLLNYTNAMRLINTTVLN